MPSLIFPAPVPAVAPIQGSEQGFPIRRIFCVGRNYEAHAKEMGSVADREAPFYFNKASEDYVASGSTVPYAPGTKNLHHEMELVVCMKSGGANIPVDKALEHVYGYAVGLDMTRRDLQNQAKDMGRPWDMGKGFDQSAPIGTIYPVSEVGHPAKGTIQLDVNRSEEHTSELQSH